jgi:hypothetical protein
MYRLSWTEANGNQYTVGIYTVERLEDAVTGLREMSGVRDIHIAWRGRGHGKGIASLYYGEEGRQ